MFKHVEEVQGKPIPPSAGFQLTRAHHHQYTQVPYFRVASSATVQLYPLDWFQQ